ncbi:MAG: ABC transporter ATP-binding protein [Thermodesulfobacteriota bacterium]|jgi:branched-chain amino acid transport system ATP-binding protein
MLELKKVNSFYGDAHILFDVNLRIGEGEVASLFGRNGVGKTTTFRSIMGLNPPKCQGQILYREENILAQPPFRIARKGIGFVPEDRQIFPNLTVRRNLIVGQKKFEDRPKKWDFDQVYEIFPKLKVLEGKLGSQLSGGEQQMLTIGRTLMGDPDILLLDEPTEGLAPLIAQDVFNMILKIKKAHNMSIFLVEQFSPQLLDFIDHCYVMERGRIVFEGSPQTIKNDTDLQKKLLGVGAKK